MVGGIIGGVTGSRGSLLSPLAPPPFPFSLLLYSSSESSPLSSLLPLPQCAQGGKNSLFDMPNFRHKDSFSSNIS